MKYLLTGLLLFLTGWVYAPTTIYVPEWVEMKARVTCYSPLQKGEKKINHRGKSIRNERGCAVSARWLLGKEIFIPEIGGRIGDDTMNTGKNSSVAKHFRRNPGIDIVIDLRWYESLNRNKSINRQLRKLDKGVTTIWVRTN